MSGHNYNARSSRSAVMQAAGRKAAKAEMDGGSDGISRLCSRQQPHNITDAQARGGRAVVYGLARCHAAGRRGGLVGCLQRCCIDEYEGRTVSRHHVVAGGVSYLDRQDLGSLFL